VRRLPLCCRAALLAARPAAGALLMLTMLPLVGSMGATT
jgi:hypothetical protein